jgi:uncharacterized protein (DUF362 family)
MANLDKPWVHLISQEKYDVAEIVAKLRPVFIQENVNVQGKTVLLKVSFVFPVKNVERTKHINTNPLLIAAVCQVLDTLGVKRVFIADAETLGSARYGFWAAQMGKALQNISKIARKKVTFAYLDEVQKDFVTPPNAVIPGIKLDYPRIVRDVDVFISMPKLKCNIFAGITLSVKNGMGLIKTNTRWKYHNDNLHGMIADIYQVRPPDYVLTDAVFAGEGQGPMEATPHPSNLLVFGNNGLAVDTVCCNLMGYAPLEIKHLRLLHERGYGPVDLAQIRLENGNLLAERKTMFARPNRTIDQIAPNIHCYEGKSCESGCPAFMKAILDGYGINKGWESLGELYVIIGKDPKIPPEDLAKMKKNKKRVIVYGNCAKAYKKYGQFYKGCSPNYIMAMLSFTWRTKLGMTPWFKYMNIFWYGYSLGMHWLAFLGGKKYKDLTKLK